MAGFKPHVSSPIMFSHSACCSLPHLCFFLFAFTSRCLYPHNCKHILPFKIPSALFIPVALGHSLISSSCWVSCPISCRLYFPPFCLIPFHIIFLSSLLGPSSRWVEDTLISSHIHRSTDITFNNVSLSI